MSSGPPSAASLPPHRNPRFAAGPARSAPDGRAVLSHVLFFGAIALLVLAVASALLRGSFWIFTVVNPLMTTVVAIIFATVGVLLREGTAEHTRLAAGVGGAALAAVATAVGIIFGFGPRTTFLDLHAPEDRAYSVVVEQSLGTPDPVWQVRIQQDRGLASRVWEFGCVLGDLETLQSVSWTSPSDLLLTTSSRSVELEVDVATGRPTPAASAALAPCH